MNTQHICLLISTLFIACFTQTSEEHVSQNILTNEISHQSLVAKDTEKLPFHRAAQKKIVHAACTHFAPTQSMGTHIEINKDNVIKN